MNDSEYITTTGERWHEGAPFNEGWIPTLLRDESENDDDCTIVRPSDILAELRALRAQRDELLAALEVAEQRLEDGVITPTIRDIRATIAKAKGEA